MKTIQQTRPCSKPDRRALPYLLILFLMPIGLPFTLIGAGPISLHPENPHYFLWRGEPTILITSGEHYGALLNLDFDYRTYFETLRKDGLNLTRTFSGAYVETEGNFNIAKNTLNPAAGRFICPWARGDEPGYADGGNKFDLTRWDENYFERLHDLVREAGRRGVVVEMNLFCPMYEESQWSVSPMNARNNVNGLGEIPREQVYDLQNSGGLLPVQEKMVRRIVQELQGFENVYFEICNEPYAKNVPMDWQRYVSDVIMDAQKDFPHKFLISENVANNTERIADPNPNISIFNFHYATPPLAVAENYHLNKVIGDNETGFRGTKDAPYRMEAWDFILAGGALFNHLDYSFAAGHEDGTFEYPSSQPGGGNPTLRRQFGILRDFINGFDFLRMKPDNSVLLGGTPEGGSARALVEPGRAYAIYIRAETTVGAYSIRWTGFVTPAFSEEFSFHTVSNDGVRLWVNGEQLINNWTDHGETEDTGRIRLEAGREYPLRLEYFYNGGQGVARLLWSSASVNRQPIPMGALQPPDRSGPGLKGEYHRGNNFQNKWRNRTDATVDFAWGTESPFGKGAGARDIPESLQLNLPAGGYRAEWVDTRNGQVVKRERFRHDGGVRPLDAPTFEEDVALRIQRR